MKRFAFAGLMMLMACGGSLSDEQRKKLHDGMDNQKIVKLSDSEIVTASLDQGRIIFAVLEKIEIQPRQIRFNCPCTIMQGLRWIVPGSPDALEVENQLIEAYVIGAETGSTQDNIQKLRADPQSEEYDSLLYSRPIVSPMADGAINVEGVWNIYFAKKDIILEVGKKQ